MEEENVSEKMCKPHIMKEIDDGYTVCVQCGRKFANISILVEINKLSKVMKILKGVDFE